MSNINGDSGKPSWPTLILIVGVAVQAVGFGVWIGAIQTEVSAHQKWIDGRDTKNFDVRLGVLENEYVSLRGQVDRLEDKLNNHIATDNALFDRFNDQHKQGLKP